MDDGTKSTPAASPAVNRGRAYRDKVALRAEIHDTVQDFTIMRRDKLRRDYLVEHPDADELEILEYLDEKQPVYDEYDPVVQLAVMSADHRHDASLRRQAMSDAAPYLRPKMKQIEMIEDPEAISDKKRKTDLAENLMNLLTAASAGRSSAQRGSPPASSYDRPAAYEDDDGSDRTED